MNDASLKIFKRRLKKRNAADRRFRIYAVSAVIFAAVFLVFFFADMIRKGWPAFMQTQVLVEFHYTEDATDIGAYAYDDDLMMIVSRGFERLIPVRLKENPELIGTKETRWVLATGDVDQYVKGKPSSIRPAAKEVVDRMEEEGRVRLVFNRWLFLNGDSKLPEQAGLWSAIIGSLMVLAITVVCSVPVGVMTAVYLEEFAPDNRFTQLIEVNINNLAAVPSILFGLLGLAIFINFIGVPRSSALAGGLTLGIMMLPIVIISTRAALRAVPSGIREGAYGVGASPWQVVWHHVLPLSLPGILTGSIIGLARAMGETAPLLMVGMMAYIPDPPQTPWQAATVLPAQIYTWYGDSQRAFSERSAAGILILLAVLLVLNGTAIWLRMTKEKRW